MRSSELALVLLLAFAGTVRAADDSPAPAAARTAEQMAALRKLVLDGLASANPKNRTAAAQAIVAAWPDSAGVLDEALNSKSPAVRLEAVNTLDTDVLGDQRARIAKRFDDADGDVRRQAVRVAGHYPWPEAEAELIRLASGDPLWPVRQEALRSLERRGTALCLVPVLEGLLAEKDLERKKRFRRVLISILKLDRGDDEAAWREAISAAQKTDVAAPKPASDKK